MFTLVFSIGKYLGSSLKTILNQVIVSVCTSFGLLLLFKEKTNKKILTEALGLIGIKTRK
ncbi:hypothetical protein ACWN8V_13060 [Vagococcus elongatus]|uniref:Uncharacterized protein n=1 Tax=Vagococcus elongatus TaxID=180344 RepID=A0A430B427_9ENTE|nr:hypothetical protein [Vagococcus elongatus]RSU15074.1 hypothetical protein CBF29_01680 [Vagococcus elongatus]